MTAFLEPKRFEIGLWVYNHPEVDRVWGIEEVYHSIYSRMAADLGTDYARTRGESTWPLLSLEAATVGRKSRSRQSSELGRKALHYNL